ncbi:MAG TPA: site-2 protease family protein [Gammaproteobacteria bacterium]|nr:site-2 protease family protein [Gammaproteobacteria bacterium]
MAELTLLQQISIWALPILFAITAHEAAHAWVAFKLGDSTAYREGRVTLNPIKHIDLIGTVILPLLMVVISGFVFGWAKPVPVNFRQLRQPRRDMALVALAGPSANLLMAIIWVIVAKLGLLLTGEFEQAIFLVYMGSAGILINLILMILNLLPILPLDGGRVLHSALPRELAISFGRLEPFGLIILVILLVTGILEKILFPLVIFMYQQFFSLAGL